MNSPPLNHDTPDEHRPLVELLRLAGPTIAQMASYTVMQFLDTWMLSRVGDRITAPTAAANSGILAFAVISFGMGVTWVVNTMVSQCYGRKDYRGCGRYLWQGVWFSVLFAGLLLPLLPWAPRAFLSLGHDPQLARMEGRYLQIVVSFSIVKLVGATFGNFMLAIDRAAYVMIATIAGVSVNAVVAWLLIFGAFGIRPLGVVGAAWAQNIGVGVETLVGIAFVLLPSVRDRFNVRDWKLRLPEMRMLAKIGIPSGVQIVADVLAWGMWGNLVMGVFGTKAMAANNFVFRYMSVSFMPAFGIATAVTALVGRYIGRGRPDIAENRAHLGFAVAATYMLGCGLLFFFARHQLIALFASDSEVLHTGATLLAFAGVYQFFDAMYITYNGALRGAGDTFVPAVATAVLCWGITVFGGYLVSQRLHWLGPAGPWIAATAYGIILGIFIYLRFRRGGWRSIQLQHASASNREMESTTVPAAI